MPSSRHNFIGEVRSFRRQLIVGGIVAGTIAFGGASASLWMTGLRLDPSKAATVGEYMLIFVPGLGLSAALGLPILCFFLWYAGRISNRALYCHACGAWLASRSRFQFVCKRSKCACCGIALFDVERNARASPGQT